MTRLPMKTHDHARRTLARMIRAYHNGELESQKFRDLVYGLSTMLAYFKHAADLKIEERLQAIEDAIAGDNRK